jgi:ankyrin repeat protein
MRTTQNRSVIFAALKTLRDLGPFGAATVMERIAVIAVFLIGLTAFGATTSPMAEAAMRGDKAAVKSLLQEKADVNKAQADGATALQWAAYKNDLEMADLLIAAGADVKARSREGATALYLAGVNGSPAMIEKLLKAGADANEPGPQGESPLMLAARNGNLDAIKILLDHKADVNATEKLRGTTAIMWAAERGNAAAVKLLIDRGANVSVASLPDSRNARNNLAPTQTQRKGQGLGAGNGRGGGRGRGGAPATPSAAGQNGATPLAPNTAAALAAAGIDASLLSGIGFDVNDFIAGGGDVAVLAEQLAAFGFGGKQVADGGGLTPLVLAARQDCLDCVKALLDAGADVNQVTKYGWTPLLTATQNRHYLLGKYLLDHGANPNLANNGGWTPLYLATDNRNIESGDYPVRTPDMDHLEYIQLLLGHGANVNARICGVKSTPTDCVGDTTETRTNFTMQWLFEDGATPFLRAAQSGDLKLMKLLLDKGANPKIFTSHGVTPLAVAAGIGWVEGVTFEWSRADTIEAVKMCIALGIDPNVADEEGRTALHGAAHKGDPEVIQLLADAGAKLDAHDKGSRDSISGALLGATWIPLDWSRGLVRVGVQSAIPHPEAEKLLISLMNAKGLPIPDPPKSSICLTKGLKGCE